MTKKKPGVMVYFEMIDAVDHLSDKGAGVLFKSILRYAREGEEPKLTATLQPLWGLIRGRIDTDDRVYREKALRNQYNVYVRWQRQQGMEPLPYEVWQVDQLSAAEEPA